MIKLSNALNINKNNLISKNFLIVLIIWETIYLLIIVYFILLQTNQEFAKHKLKNFLSFIEDFITNYTIFKNSTMNWLNIFAKILNYNFVSGIKHW